MKNLHKNFSRVLPMLALSAGATLAFNSALQAKPGQPDGDGNGPPPRQKGAWQGGQGGNGGGQFGRGRGNRGGQFGQDTAQVPHMAPAPRVAVPTVEELTDALNLTPDQQKKMSGVLAEMQKRINNTLTSEQRTKLEKLRTEPLAPPLARADEGSFDQRGEGGQEGRGNRQGMGGRGGRQGMGGGQGFGGRQGMDGPGRPGMGQRGMRPRPRQDGMGPDQQGLGQPPQPQPMGGAQDEDHGRPVEAVAKELGVTPEQFRAAFRKVHPAGAGQEPTQAQRIANRKVLSESLGVSPERLDEVMDKYRPGGRGTNGPIQ